MTEISLEGSFNVRAIGSADQPWLMRGGALDRLSPSDEATLRARGVDLVVDLREPSEHADRAHEIPVCSVPLFREEPPAQGDLESIYRKLLQTRGHEITRAVLIIAEHSGTVIVNCTAGKDRTGIVVALARLAAGDESEDVLADYARSGPSVRRARLGLVAARLDAMGLAGQERDAAERLHLDSPAEALAFALTLIDAMGGPREYLLRHGATQDQLAALASVASRSKA